MMNVFDNLETGIIAQGGNLKVMNCTFQNINYSATSKLKRTIKGIINGVSTIYNQSGSAIWSDAMDVGNYNLIAKPSTNLSNDGNQFIDCYMGIQTFQLLTHDIQYNSFRSSQSLINASALPTNGLSSIHIGKYGIKAESDRVYLNELSNNVFSNVENGIYFKQRSFVGGCNITPVISPQVYSDEMNIKLNQFKAVTGTTLFQYINLPICVENIHNNVYCVINSKFTISNNTIAAFNGILVNGFTSTLANSSKDIHCKQNNSIVIIPNVNTAGTSLLVGPTANTPTQFGIKYTNCKPNTENFIWKNTILMNNGSTNPLLMEYSVAIKGSTLCKVQCNSSIGFDYAYEFDASSTCQFLRNSMQNCRKAGFEISNGAFIGAQGGTATTPNSDNSWGTPSAGKPAWGIGTGQVPMTNVDGSIIPATTASGQPLYVVSSPTSFNPDGFGNATFYPLRYASTTGTINVSNASPMTYKCSTPISIMKPFMGNGNIDKDVVIGILGGENAPLELETNYSMKLQSYQDFRVANDTVRDSILLNEPQLQDFYQLALNSNMEKLCLIEDKIGEGLFNDATNLINGFSANNDIEKNFINYYKWHIAYYTDSALTNAQLEGLRILGTNCPATEGAAVYMAQALYHSIVPEDFIMESNCGNDEIDSSNMRKMIKKVNAANSIFNEQIEIYPNPTENQFNIIVANTITTCDVTICNSLGQMLFTKNFTDIDKLISIQETLPKGFYFVTIKNNITNEICNKKIIVQ